MSATTRWGFTTLTLLTHSLKATGFEPLPLNINPGFKTCLSNSTRATTTRRQGQAADYAHRICHHFGYFGGDLVLSPAPGHVFLGTLAILLGTFATFASVILGRFPRGILRNMSGDCTFELGPLDQEFSS
jgi:hypothetical protein